MDLTVNYNTFEAKFWHNNILLFSGFRTTERWRYKWLLFTQDSNLICEVKSKVKFISFSLSEEYLISYTNNGNSYSLTLYFKWKKAHYTVDFDRHSYEIIIHKGNKISFFKDQQQFAYLTEPALTVGSSTSFHVVADDDCDIAFLCTLIFAIKCTEETNDGNINLNIGNIGPELKKFDNQWRPKLNPGVGLDNNIK